MCALGVAVVIAVMGRDIVRYLRRPCGQAHNDNAKMTDLDLACEDSGNRHYALASSLCFSHPLAARALPWPHQFTTGARRILSPF